MNFVKILFFFFSTFFICDEANGKIIQVQIIHRHGARHPLVKHPFDPQIEHRTGSLFDEGKLQLKLLGNRIREEYIIENASNRIDGIKTSPLVIGDIKAYSSNFERTLLSSRAFLSGLYPNNQDDANVPTFVFNGSETDWLIRAYAICPKLTEKFKQFTNQDEYKERKKKHGSFITKLAKKLGEKDTNTTFENVFNIFDRFNIIDSGYEDISDEDKKIKLSNDDMTRLKQIADWYESRKFAYGTHGIHVAGGLLKRIMNQADEMTNKIVVYSAHYPTLLTLLASIRQEQDADKVEWPADTIPEFGAALIIEVHQLEEKVIKMKWYQGGDDKNIEMKFVSIGRNPCIDGEKGCTKSQLDRLVAFQTMGETQFCTDCSSNSGVCLNTNGDKFATTPCSSTNGRFDTCGNNKYVIGIVGVVIGLILGLVIGLIYVICTTRRKRKRMERVNIDEDFGSIVA